MKAKNMNKKKIKTTGKITVLLVMPNFGSFSFVTETYQYFMGEMFQDVEQKKEIEKVVIVDDGQQEGPSEVVPTTASQHHLRSQTRNKKDCQFRGVGLERLQMKKQSLESQKQRKTSGRWYETLEGFINAKSEKEVVTSFLVDKRCFNPISSLVAPVAGNILAHLTEDYRKFDPKFPVAKMMCPIDMLKDRVFTYVDYE